MNKIPSKYHMPSKPNNLHFLGVMTWPIFLKALKNPAWVSHGVGCCWGVRPQLSPAIIDVRCPQLKIQAEQKHVLQDRYGEKGPKNDVFLGVESEKFVFVVHFLVHWWDDFFKKVGIYRSDDSSSLTPLRTNRGWTKPCDGLILLAWGCDVGASNILP